MLKPVYTEKSLKMAALGKYSFWVEVGADKGAIKSEIAKTFNVHVLSVKTIKTSGEKGRNARGRKFTILAGKKAIVTLKDGEKINLFEESKK